MPGLRPPFLLRRIASAWPLLTSLMLTVFIAAALLTALATFNAQVLPQAALRQLASSAQTGMAVSGPVDATVARADMPAVGAALRGAFGAVPYRLNSALWSDPLVLPGAAGSRVIQLLEAGAPGQFTAHARLVSGSWPGPPRPGRPVQAALPASVAARIGASVGDVLSVQDRSNGDQARIQVSGTFERRDPGSPYWGLDIVGPSGVSVSPGYITYGPLIVSPAAFRGGRPALAVGAVSWAAALDTQRIQASQIPGLASRITGAAGYLQGTPRLGGLQVTGGLPRLLDGLTRSLAVARSMLAISALQLLLLAAAALVLAGRLLTSHRGVETALLGSRGAAGWQLARITMAEIAVVGGLGAAGGALAGTRLASLLAGAGSLRDARLRLAGFPGSVWLAVALVLALCLAVTLWPTLRPATPGAVAALRGRPAAIAGIARSGGDIAIIVLAVIAVRELRTYSAVAHLPTGGLGIDPVLSATPALALAAASLILLRLMPLAARAMERLIARSRHLGAALASWQISRRTVTQSGPVLLAVLAVATGTLALAQYQSWQRSARDQAAFAAGADVRVATARPASLGRAGAISNAPGVAAAMPVTVEPTALHGSLLAVGAPQAARTVLLRPDLSPLPASQLWRRIISPRPGLALPGRPARIAIEASISGGAGQDRLGRLGRASATASIQDAGGAVYTIPAGTIPADGRDHPLIASLALPGRASYPLRLIGLSLTYGLPHYPSKSQLNSAALQRDTLTLASVAEATSATGRFAAPFARGAALGDWGANGSAPSLASLNGVTINGRSAGAQPPSVAGWQAAGGGQRLSFHPGFGPDPGQLYYTPPDSFTGMLTIAVHPPDPVVPGIATEEFLSSNHLHPGTVIDISIAGSQVPVRIAAVVVAFPTTTSAIIVDQGAVQDLLVSRGSPPLPVSQWWLRTAGGAVPPGLPAGSTVTDRASLQSSLVSNSLSAAPLLEGLAIAAAAAVLAGLGFSVGVAASVRDRRSQSALLAALGYSPRAQVRGLCLEELMLTVPATLAGLGVGIGLAHLIIPAITLTASASAPVPGVLVEVPLGWAALVALAVVVTPVLIAAIVLARRRDPAAELRAAETT
ncbi:MAG TPA: FtsX-like permease family protein [Streptosporangiaceae bacterium]|nr:FtsX-like permease family protein [Streptosporangiaceae bacterium]